MNFYSDQHTHCSLFIFRHVPSFQNIEGNCNRPISLQFFYSSVNKTIVLSSPFRHRHEPIPSPTPTRFSPAICRSDFCSVLPTDKYPQQQHPDKQNAYNTDFLDFFWYGTITDTNRHHNQRDSYQRFSRSISLHVFPHWHGLSGDPFLFGFLLINHNNSAPSAPDKNNGYNREHY